MCPQQQQRQKDPAQRRLAKDQGKGGQGKLSEHVVLPLTGQGGEVQIMRHETKPGGRLVPHRGATQRENRNQNLRAPELRPLPNCSFQNTPAGGSTLSAAPSFRANPRQRRRAAPRWGPRWLLFRIKPKE